MKPQWVYEIAAEPIANLRAAGISGRITRAENFDTGERVGKPDTNTYIDVSLIFRAEEYNARVYGRKR